jgi:hypothetical protein
LGLLARPVTDNRADFALQKGNAGGEELAGVATGDLVNGLVEAAEEGGGDAAAEAEAGCQTINGLVHFCSDGGVGFGGGGQRAGV